MDKRMARRYFNWTLAIVLVVALTVFSGAVFALHRWQRSTRAERALPQGEQAYAQEQWDVAAEQLGSYLSVRNDDMAALQKYADAQLKRRPLTGGHVQHAIAAYQSILRLDGSNAEAAKRLTELYLTTASPNEAEQIATAYLDKKKDDPEVRRMLALALAQQRKYSDAEKTLQDLVNSHPDDVLAYEMLGRLADERSTDVNAPAGWYDQAIKANPQSAMAYIIRGVFHRQPRHWDPALAMADFDQASKCDLSDEDTHLRLAQELIRAHAYDKAKEHLTALQAQAPKKAMLWQSWAAVVLATGSPEEKLTVAETGLKELAAYPWDFMATAVELFTAANQPEKALDCVLQMRQRGLQPATLAFLDGLVAGSKGNVWEAAARWQDALTQGHKVHAYAGGLGAVVPVRMMLANSYMQLGDLQSANIQLRALVTENPTYAEGRLALARLMTRMKDWAGVLEQVREAQRSAPGHPEAVLLETQARIFMLSDAGESAPNREQAWQEIEKQLAVLDKATQGAVQVNGQVKLLQAQAMARQGKSAEAVKLLEGIRAKNPSDIRATLLQVELLAAQNKSQEAVSLLKGAIEQTPQEVELVRTLALLLNGQNDAEQCESVIKQAIGRIQQPNARRELGLLLADLYRFWRKEADLYQCLTDMAGQFPNDIRIKRQLLTCPAVAKNVQQAQTLVDQIKSLEGEKGWQWRYEQAKVWVNSEDFAARYTQITTLLQENLLANPDDQASRMLLAAAHEKGGQRQLALSAYREALSRSPNNIEIITQTVAALYRSGGAADLADADKYLKRAGEQQLTHPDLEKLEIYGQGMRWRDQIRRGAIDSASDTLQQLVQRNPNDVSASLALAGISMQQGRLDEAEVILKGLEAKGLETKSLQYVSVMQARTRLYILRGNVQEALRLCDETVQKNGQAIAYLLRAWTYAGLKENEKAIEDFGQAVAMDPNNAVDRAGFYQVIGRRQEAIQDIRKVLSLPAGGQSVLQRVIPMCLATGSRTLIQEAETALDSACTANPNAPELKLLKAQFLLSRRTKQSIEQGQRLLREITAARPQLSQAWNLLGRLELSQGQPGRALDTALSGLSHNERDRELLLLKAEAEAARSPALALPTLRPLLTQYPNDIEIEMRLATALYKSGDKENSRSMIEARLKADPDNPIPVATLAGLLGLDGRWAEVTGQVTNWLDKHPNDVLVAPAVARTLMIGGNPEALKTAESLLNMAIQRNSKSVQALSTLALLVQSAGRTAEAAALNRRVLELDPNDVIALNNLAWVLCEENGKYQESLELAERGLKVTPDYADLLDTRGVALYRLGQFEKAAEDFAKCVELYTDDARSKVSAHFHLARAYVRMGRTAQAQQCLKQTMDLQDQTGGLSTTDLAEAKLLSEQLQNAQ
jgi:tetratricopeptide (TPR) repeat protein